MNQDAAIKIRMLQGSMRCFVFGLLGLLPVLGLPFAVSALWNSGRVRKAEKQFWNAARPYRLCGEVLAGVGMIVWITIIFFVMTHAQDLGKE